MENSKIEWTTHTFNPWWGCIKVSPGCKNCYAETLDARFGKDPHWGPNSPRKHMSPKYWKQPYAWNAAAQAANERARVFCASMADVFEDHPDVVEDRARLFRVIDETPWLDWQLLTKRPENIRRLIPADWLTAPRPNVWFGTSCENQETADKRIPELCQVPAAVRFLSCEPLLGPINIGLLGTAPKDWGYGYTAIYMLIHWVIVGGESGHGARPMYLQWARDIRNECQDGGVAFLFKQWGEWKPTSFDTKEPGAIWLDKNGYQFDHQPRQMQCFGVNPIAMLKVGKKEAGRLLDGVEHSQYPER